MTADIAWYVAETKKRDAPRRFGREVIMLAREIERLEEVEERLERVISAMGSDLANYETRTLDNIINHYLETVQ